jgi:O-antigen ligase
VAAGIGAVAVSVLVDLFGSAPGHLFVEGRLNLPLGYINAEATVFIMGFWLCFSVVERRAARLAGAGAGTATLMACLALLTQSRGAVLAMVGSIVVVMALVPGSRVRRAYALLACAAGVAAAGGPLADVYDTATTAGSIPADVGHRAALAIVVASLGVGIVWAGALLALRRLAERRPELPARLARTGVAVLAAGALLVAGVAVASAGRIEEKLSTQWTAFTSNGSTLGARQASTTTDRLVSGSGARYDYWRVAVDAFAEKPLLGVGAGNYDRPYYQKRTTAEDVHQPHSIELQALSELGLGGAALLACFIAGLAIAAVRMRAAASASPLSATLMVAGVGVVTSWLVHTSVDWIHLMPGITGIALVMIAPLALNRRPAEAVVRAPARTGRFALRPVAVAGAGLAGLALVVGASSLSRQGLADVFRNRADDALAARPADAIKEANRSLRLDAENPRTYYIKAAALARFNAAEAARQTLVRAASKEPDNFVTWTLLGDLAVRRGRLAEAQRNYRRASALNPQDLTLRQLAKDPKSALQGTTP